MGNIFGRKSREQLNPQFATYLAKIETKEKGARAMERGRFSRTRGLPVPGDAAAGIEVTKKRFDDDEARNGSCGVSCYRSEQAVPL